MTLKDETVLEGDWEHDELSGFLVAPSPVSRTQPVWATMSPVAASKLFDSIDVNGDGVVDR